MTLEEAIDIIKLALPAWKSIPEEKEAFDVIEAAIKECDRWELRPTEYVLPKGFKWPDRTLAEDLANLEKEEWPEIHLGGLDVVIPSELDIRKLEERIRRLEEWLT